MTPLLLKYWWAGLIALCALALWVQETRVQSTHAALTQAKGAADNLRQAREQAVRQHQLEIAAVVADHQKSVEEKDHVFQRELGQLEMAATHERTRAASLRDQLAAATRRGARVETSAAFCERERHRLEDLGRLAGEGAELVAEAGGLLRQRDAEVKRLLGQIESDRAAVEKAAAIQAFVR